MHSCYRLKDLFIFIISFVIIIMVIFAAFFYAWVEKLIQRQTYNYFEGMSIKSEQTVSNYLNGMKETAKLTSYSHTVQEYLFESSAIKKINSQSAATDLINNIISSFDYIYEIAFIKNNGSIFQAKGNYTNLIRSVVNNNKILTDFHFYQPFFTGAVYDISNPFDRETPYFFYIYPVYSLIDGEFSVDNSAVCMILGKIDDISEKQIVGLDKSETVALLEENETIISSRKLSETELNSIRHVAFGRDVVEIGGDELITYRQNLEGTRWNTIIIASEKYLSHDLHRLKKASITFMGASSIALLILILICMRSLSLPIQNLLHEICSIELNKNENARVTTSGIEEINQISCSINEMLDKISLMTTEQTEIQKKLYQASLSQKQAQLQYYRSQINPHFLYNTLECIRSMSQVYGAECIENICTAMARMFRYSANDVATVTIKEEIKHTRDYFTIIAQRQSNLYRLRIAVDQSIQNRNIQKMILQPIVENCIKHAFEGKDCPCMIHIIGKITNKNMINIKIIDNGFGISPQQLREINKKMERQADDETISNNTVTGIGLYNINKRLRLVYGDSSRLYLTSKYGFFTCVEFSIPLDSYEC